jgi:small subunit ribosomal protein S20
MKLRGMRCVCILTRTRLAFFTDSQAYVALAPISLTIQGFQGSIMANHVSSLKRARQTETKTAVNRNNRTRVRNSLRALREAIAKGDVKAAQAQFRETVSALDKSVQKGVLHSNTVSRYKSRLNARLKALSTTKA